MFRKKPKTLDVNGYQITPGANLAGADLSGLFSVSESTGLSDTFLGVDLSGANLTGANLRYLSLHQSSLVGANLTGAKLGGYSQAGANFCGASFEKAELDSDFVGCNFSGVTFDTALFQSCRFSDCNFEGATFKDSKFVSDVDDVNEFKTCNLAKVQFTRTNLSFSVWFDDCNLTRAKFENLRMKAVFENCDLRAAEFLGVTGEFFPTGTCKTGDIKFGDSQLLRDGNTPSKPASKNVAPESSDIENRLEEIESLLESGLIDEDEYDALRMKILGI